MKKRILINILLLMPFFFVALSATGPMGGGIAILFGTLILSVLGAAVSWMAWNLTYQPYRAESDEASQQADQSQSHRQKRKRETLDNVLRDLSDEQLDSLRRRLQDGTIDDDVLERRIVGADGELIQQR